jgi:hypothetical protein
MFLSEYINMRAEKLIVWEKYYFQPAPALESQNLSFQKKISF